MLENLIIIEIVMLELLFMWIITKLFIALFENLPLLISGKLNVIKFLNKMYRTFL